MVFCIGIVLTLIGELSTFQTVLEKLWYEKLTPSPLGTIQVLQRLWQGLSGTFIGPKWQPTAINTVLLALFVRGERVKAAKRKHH